MNEKMRKIIGVGVEPISLVCTIVVIIVIGILQNFDIFQSGTVASYVFDTVFYISLAILLIQVLIQQHFIRDTENIIKETTDTTLENTESIISDTTLLKEVVSLLSGSADNIDTKAASLLNKTEDIKKSTALLNMKIKLLESVVFPKNVASVNKRIEDVLNTGKASKVQIICYGTNRFGRIVDGIMTTHTSASLEIIVCSPDVVILNDDSDSTTIVSNIKEMIKYPNIKLLASSVPPTIRACLVLDKSNNPVWCSLQPYYIFKDSTRIFRGENFSPAIVADEDSSILADLSFSFNNEFERLSSYCETITSEEFNRKYRKTKDDMLDA